MAEIIWTEPALNNVNDIAEYIALHNEQAAKALVQKVFTKVDRLSEHPNSGKVPAELQGFSFREVVVPPCRIFYKIENDTIFILYVMRQEQEFRKFMINK
ncbi:type II toxin-antitoxin system RelE/ParE family toxin [Thalassotalea sp. LPB0316]|uniref:type II toxin-antitoxin system RelE/ParE family toxin n=1 Tax=Thalassotalea sp. LPB0316 TaxID=2769490 RepID=UPI001869632F|nr:type II toxin-antitoxin system RelE/ParE family toxin [Thalassotalea sp. LPB0316]QOL25970.1 type II toxin-antitoxin system RelE/ParE family toxin [Thalassotalea sp. LPB0316]